MKAPAGLRVHATDEARIAASLGVVQMEIANEGIRELPFDLACDGLALAHLRPDDHVVLVIGAHRDLATQHR